MERYISNQNDELSIVSFDYSKLTNDERLSTLENEKKLDELYQRYQPEIGKILYEQQQILANHTDGTFQQWYESKGFKRWKVYDYINKYQYVLRNSEDPRKIDIFENMPKSLQSEIAKPSAKAEAVEKVLSGDIKTTKEYRELEKQLKSKDEQIEMQARMIEDLNEQEPQVIEKEVVIEKIPSDYKELKRLSNEISSENQSLKQEKEQLEREMTQKNEALQMKRTIENDELEQAQLVRLQRNADISVHKLIISINDFVKEQSVTVYDSEAIAGATTETKEKLSNSIKRVEKLLSEIKQEIGGEVAWIIN